MIPKIIHYCWLSDDPVPDDLQRCMQTWKEKLPDYEFMLWNFDRFDITLSRWVRQAFEAKKYASAADYIRLYAVYNYGGIYMDMDIEVVKSFDDMLDAPLMLAYENDEQTGIEAGCFGAEKEHPLIKEILGWYQDRPFTGTDGYTCPKIMVQYTYKHPNVQIYEKDHFTCKSHKTGVITTTQNSHAIHHFAGSWLSPVQQKLIRQREAISAKFGENVISATLIKILNFAASVRERGMRATLQSYSTNLRHRGASV